LNHARAALTHLIIGGHFSLETMDANP